MAYEIDGNWKGGWALDLHTTSSIMCEDGSFENTYSDIGKALNRLKYHGEEKYIDELVSKLVSFLKTRLVTPHLGVIVPTPASKDRELQPVYEIAKRVADNLGIKYDPDYIIKVKDTSELKSIESPDERKKALEGVFNVGQRYKDKKILIIDDLFRSGSTLQELTKTMYDKGNVNNVYVVTLTKTRVHR